MFIDTIMDFPFLHLDCLCLDRIIYPIAISEKNLSSKSSRYYSDSSTNERKLNDIAFILFDIIWSIFQLILRCWNINKEGYTNHDHDHDQKKDIFNR